MTTSRQLQTPTKHFDPKDPKVLVFEVYKRDKKTVYHVRGNQAKSFGTIILDGYQGLPPGLFLYRRGFGLGRKGTFLLAGLKSILADGNDATLTISSSDVRSVTGTNPVRITLPYSDVHDLLVRFGRINEDSNNEIRRTISSFLATVFPQRVAIGDRNFNEYKGGELASVLRRDNVAKKLSEEDFHGLEELLPKLLDGGRMRRPLIMRRKAFVTSAKSSADKMLLDDVIAEFAKLLSRGASEQKWQTFLQTKVFRFLANYVTAVEKQNVSLLVSYPDFVLVDVYGFIDVFEIKRSSTALLAFDKSHNNYFWKPELVKAIAQIENYIDAVIANADAYIRAVRLKKQVDIKVVRPRGYIIAGTAADFESAKALDDFRKLSMSLKNINFVLYDELLERLKNLRKNL